MKRLFLCLTILFGFSSFTPSGAANAADISTFDIIGIKLGMKPDEVKAAISKHDPEFKIEEYHRTYGYSDGVQNFQSDEILGRLAVRSNKIVSQGRAEIETVFVDFTGTPGKEVVTAVVRSRAGDLNPPSVKDFVKILTDKYGKFDHNDRQMIEWYGDNGTQTCFNTSGMSELSAPLMESQSARDMEDFSPCRDTMTYSIGSSQAVDSLDMTTPVTGFNVNMVGAKLLVEKDAELQAWVENLEKEATAKRTSKVEAPKL